MYSGRRWASDGGSKQLPFHQLLVDVNKNILFVDRFQKCSTVSSEMRSGKNSQHILHSNYCSADKLFWQTIWPPPGRKLYLLHPSKIKTVSYLAMRWTTLEDRENISMIFFNPGTLSSSKSAITGQQNIIVTTEVSLAVKTVKAGKAGSCDEARRALKH